MNKRIRKKIPVPVKMLHQFESAKILSNKLTVLKLRNRIVRRLFSGKKYLLNAFDSPFELRVSLCINGAKKKHGAKSKLQAIEFALKDFSIVKARLEHLSAQAANRSFKDYGKYSHLNHLAGALSHGLKFVIEIIEKDLKKTKAKLIARK